MMIDDQDLATRVLVEHVSTQKMLARLRNVGVGPERDALVPVRSQHVVRHNSVARRDDGDASILVAIADVAA